MISIIIPAYNEENRISSTLSSISIFFDSKHIDYEIVVAVDGCKDRTKEVVDGFCKKNHKIKLTYNEGRSGKGGALLRGFLNSKGDKIVFADSDSAASPEELLKLTKLLDSYDVAWGRRKFKNKQDAPPIYRSVIGRSYGCITMLLFLSRFYDVQSGYKAFRRNVLEDVFPKLKTLGIEYDLDLLTQIRKGGYKIVQPPIWWKHVEGSPSYNAIDHFYTYTKEMMRIRLRTI